MPPSRDHEASEESAPAMTNGLAVKKEIVNGDGKAKKEKELVKIDPAEIGMRCGKKKLYSGKEDKRGRFQWQDTIPEDVGKPAEDAESAKWALIVRNVKVYNDPRKVLKMHSILVQSPLLKKLLEKVLKDYPGVTVGLQRLEFSDNFEPLIHRWAQLNEAIAELGDSTEEERETRSHARLLQETLEEEFKDLIEQSQDMKNKGVMTWDLLWTLFQPGALVYAKQDGQETALKLHETSYGKDRHGNHCFWLSCKYVEWDGVRFGTNKMNLSIIYYNGTRPITSLSAFPLDYHHHKDELSQRLIERGTKAESLAGSHYKAYQGPAWRRGPTGNRDKYTIRGRIVIDTYGWNRFNPNFSIYVTPFHAKDSPTLAGLGNGQDYEDEDDAELPYDDDCDDGDMPPDGFFADDEDEGRRPPLTEEQKLICTPLIRGYALKDKLWLNFYVNSVKEIEWSAGAFDSLVLPKNQKELILGFTESQRKYKGSFDDVIEGKGKGIILLLCGPPGVGKTLTAESVAEEMKVPLYMMSAGDLGLDPRNVESKLQNILEMCTKWNAILLLDEADVFLEQRSLHELERNKLVSIFLRILEYYEGIMFLTTNRVNTFDPAFQSRIHISLDYPPLSIQSRRVIWTNFLHAHDVSVTAAHKEAAEKAGNPAEKDKNWSNVVTPRELDALSQMDMNGRQIKNVLKTAQLLAARKEEPLSYEHVNMVLDVTQHLHNSTMESERTRSSIFC